MRQKPSRFFLIAAASLAAAMGISACSGRQTKKTNVEISDLAGRKVALVEVEGEPTARSVVEVALVNQLVQRGSFELVSKQKVEAARHEPSQDINDWRGIARAAGADTAMRAKVLTFEATENKGFSEEEIDDSEMEAETGNGKTKRIFPVKSLEGHVAVQLEFTDVSPNGNGNTTTGVAEASDSAQAEARTTAAHLPPRLRFLEKIANEAFKKFFDTH